MVAFDTNYLIRHILQDDPKQNEIVNKLVNQYIADGKQIRILNLVLMETCWVLMSYYKINKKAWIEIIENLLDDPIFLFENNIMIRKAIELYQKGKADFDDYQILATAQTYDCQLKTFDKRLITNP